VPTCDGQNIELLLRFARAAHEAGGYPASDLEPRIVELGQALGLPAVEVSAKPTVVELTVGPIHDQQVYVLRVRPSPVDLHAIGRLDEIAAAVTCGQIDRRRAIDELDELRTRPLRRPAWLMVVAAGVVSAAIAPILGGGWHESVAAAAVAIVAAGVTQLVVRSDRSAALAAPLGAFVASFLAGALARAGFSAVVQKVTFAALMPFFPGMPMAIGVRELATAHLEAGLANTVNALVQLVGLVFGVALGRSLVQSWLGPIPFDVATPFSHGLGFAVTALVGPAFVVMLRVTARDAIWTCSAAVLAVVLHRAAADVLGEVPGVFASAVAIGVAGNAVARRFRRSPLAFIVPGSLMLLPGSVGYQSASSFLAGQTTAGINTAYSTFVTMLAIAYGLVAATLILSDHASPARARDRPDHSAGWVRRRTT
jgi:uncharacterized membrane protein YjjP (DUF1212 family)